MGLRPDDARFEAVTARLPESRRFVSNWRMARTWRGVRAAAAAAAGATAGAGAGSRANGETALPTGDSGLPCRRAAAGRGRARAPLARAAFPHHAHIAQFARGATSTKPSAFVYIRAASTCSTTTARARGSRFLKSAAWRATRLLPGDLAGTSARSTRVSRRLRGSRRWSRPASPLLSKEPRRSAIYCEHVSHFWARDAPPGASEACGGARTPRSARNRRTPVSCLSLRRPNAAARREGPKL